mgnify:CR=1 FL=1
MTIVIGNNDPRIFYFVAESAVQTSFTVPFEFFDNADLNFYVDGTLKSITTHYTVSGGDGSTGTITTTSGNQVTGISGGSTVIITRSIAQERKTDFPTSGPFNIASLNTELDRFTAIAADLQDSVDRSLKLIDYDSAVDTQVPLLANRKGTVLGFNLTTGAAEAGPQISDVQSLADVSADIAALADIEDGTTATDAISGLAAIKSNVTTVAGISSNVTTVAGNTSNINTVAGVSANVTTVAGVASNVTTVANISSDVTSAAGISSDITSAASTFTTSVVNNIATLTPLANSIEALGPISSNITAVANDATDIGNVAASITNINLVASNINSGILTAINDFGSVANATVTTNDYGSL